jgi:hypothetical protein
VSDVPNMSIYGHIVNDIKSGMRHFRMASIAHIKREANSAVNGLAHETVIYIVDKIRMEEISHWIYNIVIKELVVPLFGP